MRIVSFFQYLAFYTLRYCQFTILNFVSQIFLTFRGLNVIRAKVIILNNMNSIVQQKQRESLKLIVYAYEALYGISDIGFPKRPTIFSLFNAILVANLQHTMDKTGAVPVIDYSKLVISNEILPKVMVPTALEGGKGITLSYKKTSFLSPKVSSTDEVVAYGLVKTGDQVILNRYKVTRNWDQY